MAPQEVAGLQALAKAHGGTLTINPDTGLPEAGFLSNILPTLIGAGLSIASGGTLTPLMAAGITGAGFGVATGSLKKGLLAGLGAYGGAGLAGSVMGAGTGAISAGTGADVAAAANNISGIAPGVEAVNAAQNSANLLGNTATSPLSGLSSGYEIGVPTQASNFSQPLSGLSSGYEVGIPTQAANMVPVTTQMPAPMSDPSIVSEATQERLLADRLAKATPMDTAKSGLGAIMDKPELLFNKGNMKYGLAAAAPLLFQEQEKKARKEEKPYEYAFDYNRVENPNAGYTGPYTGERTYFNPTFTRTAAGGGLMDIGPVEAMSNRNEAETLTANGGQMFAEGGETKAVSKVEDNPYYTMTGQSGDAFKYLMGQGAKGVPAAAVVPAAAAAAPAVVATPASLAGATGDLANSYVFNPATGTFASIGTTTASTSPATAAQYYSAGSDSPNTGVTPQQAAVFDFMNTDAGRSYKDMYGAANSSLIGSLMPGSMVLGAIKGEFTNPFTAFRDAQAAYSLAERAMQAQQSAPVESMGGTVSGFSNADPGGMFGGAQSGDVGFAYGGLAALAGGGITGSGNLDLHIPLDFGGGQGGMGGMGGYSPSGVSAQYGFNGQNNAGGGGFGASIDPQGIMSDTFKGTGAFGGNPTESINNLFNVLGGKAMAQGGMAQGGMSHLGDYSDGGRLLRGPGDGVSDSIPASIGDKRPARLADGEFVVPARIVSELGNGSTEAGARKLYAMMDRVQKARGKTVGKDRVAVNSKAEKMLPA
jgi:hypothetical protein